MAGVEGGEFDNADSVGFHFHQNHQETNIAMNINENGRVPKEWILLDIQSTVDVFHNEELLENIRQGNQSSILLERHGRASSSKRTRHINIRYFFVTDRIASGEVTVEYCPTK